MNVEKDFFRIPIEFNGDLFGVKFENEPLVITNGMFETLTNLGVNLDGNATNTFENVNNVNDAIKVLFMLSKVTDAWKLIEKYAYDLDWNAISTFEAFAINRNAVSAFRVLYEATKDERSIYERVYS